MMYDPLFSIPAPLDSGDWIKFTFQTPFQFDGSTNFIVEYWFDSTNFNPAQGNPILIGNVIYGKPLRRIACGNWVANTTNWAPENLEANIDMLGIDLASTGVEDISEQESLSVYPNPAQGSLSISGMNKGAYQISDMVGKMLLQGSYAGKGIDISSLSQGVYLIQITTGERKQTLKFVKE
ncbi:MAG: T9SS type A sorting domain-containing protein [Bacteroidetes bacterium]|nr:T9SS type A sorting domain-containing protein [Bacteroidota bacterium]